MVLAPTTSSPCSFVKRANLKPAHATGHSYRQFAFCVTMLILFSSALFSQTLIYSVQDGKWSDPHTWWGNSVPNCDFVVVKHSVVLDRNVGTGCGGTGWIRVEDTGTLTIDNSQPRTISFASSGSDPIGSGSAGNPGADANMFGFIVSGTLDIEGTPSNWVTLTSNNDSSPIYIHHQAEDYIGCTALVNDVCNGHPAVDGASLKMRYVNARHFGTTTQYYDGVAWDMRSGTSPANSLDVRFSQFTDLNQIVHYDSVTSNRGVQLLAEYDCRAAAGLNHSDCFRRKSQQLGHLR